MNLIRTTLLFCLIASLSCVSPADSDFRLKSAAKQLEALRDASAKAGKIPRSTDASGGVKWIEQPYDWTEGFWPGTCWMIYEQTRENAWKEAAIQSQKIFEAHKDLTNDHDLGFIFNNSYGKGFKITGDTNYRNVLLDATRSLCTRFNKNVGLIQSWDVVGNWQSERGWKFPVIIDNMMNLEMLFEASNIANNDSFKTIAITHANTTMRNHYRSDGSSYHVVDYNPQTGEIASKVTAQGYAVESAWARGQAWGLYAFTMCYRYTKDKKYLDFAEKIARFLFNHPNYPKDGVPYWDFNAPNIPNEKRDASAAAIMASALIELSDYTSENYLQKAKLILNTLSGPDYLAKPGQNGNFLLMHSVGSIPHGNEIDVPLNYADYYYIEALQRLKSRGESIK